MAQDYVRYRDDVEVRQPDEDEVIDQIIASMGRESRMTEERYGHAVRSSHAKSHGLVRGELRVRDNLAGPLRQGLFAQPKTYPVIVRLSHVPGEILDDRGVSTPRGMAIKVLNVEGPKLPGHEHEATQDFVLDTGKVFPSADARTFLATIKALEKATPAPEGFKSAVSAVSRASNAALKAVGGDSANLDFFGHPRYHPLAEAYFTQAAIRYGDYIAKLGFTPDSPGLKELIGQTLDMGDDENALRTAVVDFFSSNPAEFEVGVQLCTDLDKMPVENAHTEWPEEDSPYRPVARLVIPAQDAYSPARQAYVDDALAFCPAHSLAAHRPLGSIMRARLKAYEVMSTARRQRNGKTPSEPHSITELPD